jgi:hypothetical protein
MSEAATLGSLLSVSRQDVDKALDLHAKDEPDSVTGKLGPAADLIADVAADKLNDALNIDCLEMLGQAWAKLKTLREYADPKKHPPGQDAVVQLGPHKISHKCCPLAELRHAGSDIKLAELKLTLELTAKFTGVALLVRDARILVAIPGEASVEAALKYKSVELAKRTTPAWKLPGQLRFGGGIPIPA